MRVRQFRVGRYLAGVDLRLGQVLYLQGKFGVNGQIRRHVSVGGPTQKFAATTANFR